MGLWYGYDFCVEFDSYIYTHAAGVWPAFWTVGTGWPIVGLYILHSHIVDAVHRMAKSTLLKVYMIINTIRLLGTQHQVGFNLLPS